MRMRQVAACHDSLAVEFAAFSRDVADRNRRIEAVEARLASAAAIIDKHLPAEEPLRNDWRAAVVAGLVMASIFTLALHAWLVAALTACAAACAAVYIARGDIR